MNDGQEGHYFELLTQRCVGVTVQFTQVQPGGLSDLFNLMADIF